MLATSKKMILPVVLFVMLAVLLPFQQKTAAYGLINHEQVADIGKIFCCIKPHGGMGHDIRPRSNPKFYKSRAIQKRMVIGCSTQAIAAGGYHTVALIVKAMFGRGTEYRRVRSFKWQCYE